MTIQKRVVARRALLVLTGLGLLVATTVLGVPALDEPSSVSTPATPLDEAVSSLSAYGRASAAFAGIGLDAEARNGLTVAIAESATAREREQLETGLVDHLPAGVTLSFVSCPVAAGDLERTSRTVTAAFVRDRLIQDRVTSVSSGLCTITIETSSATDSPAADRLRRRFPFSYVTVVHGGIDFQQLMRAT